MNIWPFNQHGPWEQITSQLRWLALPRGIKCEEKNLPDARTMIVSAPGSGLVVFMNATGYMLLIASKNGQKALTKEGHADFINIEHLTQVMDWLVGDLR